MSSNTIRYLIFCGRTDTTKVVSLRPKHNKASLRYLFVINKLISINKKIIKLKISVYFFF